MDDTRRVLLEQFDEDVHGRGDVAVVDLVNARQQVDAEDGGQQQRRCHAHSCSQCYTRASTDPRRRGRCGFVHEAHISGQWLVVSDQ